MTDNSDNTSRTDSITSSIRGMLPRRHMVSGAFDKLRQNMTAGHLLKNSLIGAGVGCAILAGKAAIGLAPDGTELSTFLSSPVLIGGGATLGIMHAMGHSLVENAADGAKEAIQHNRTCDQIENAICQNPELLQQAAANRAASYQFDHEPGANRNAQAIIQQTEARRAPDALASQVPLPGGGRGL